jgi:hypothetical protein
VGDLLTPAAAGLWFFIACGAGTFLIPLIKPHMTTETQAPIQYDLTLSKKKAQRQPIQWWWKKREHTALEEAAEQLKEAEFDLLEEQEKLEEHTRNVDHSIANIRMIQARMNRLNQFITPKATST